MKRLTETPSIQDGCHVENATLGRYTELASGTTLLNSEFGDYSYTSGYADIANASVGKFVNIASFVRIGATDHPMTRASQHHMLYRSAQYWDDAEDDAAFFAARRARRTVIGHDVWLGHMAMVKPEVTVGHGAVIGAGAVVTKDVAPYTIVAGNPARVVRARHRPETAERLMALAWWDWDHARLRAALDDFRSLEVEAFLEKYEGAG
ncbi:MAG: chloramphenicol acetyltransferase [Pseudomonadota bacterium]